jgi:hypothetical protein
MLVAYRRTFIELKMDFSSEAGKAMILLYK